MNNLGVLVDWLTLLSIWIGVAVIYFSGQSYLKEKGKNLATREDIGKITEVVEGIRLQNHQDLEQLKSRLSDTSEALGRRRDVYEKLSGALRVFVQGQFPDQSVQHQRQQEFLDSYISAWLWAPDELIRAINVFIYLNLREPAEDNPKQRELKSAFFQIIFQLRKDAGFPTSTLQFEDLAFVQF